MWNKSLELNKQQQIVISDNQDTLAWFHTYDPNIQTYDLSKYGVIKHSLTHRAKTIFYDLDSTTNTRMIDELVAMVPFATKIGFSKIYTATTVIDVLKKGFSRCMVFPPNKKELDQVIKYETNKITDFNRAEFLIEQFLRTNLASSETSVKKSCLPTIMRDHCPQSEDTNDFIDAKIQVLQTLIATKKIQLTGQVLLTFFPYYLLDNAPIRNVIKNKLTDIFGDAAYTNLIQANPTILIVEDEIAFREQMVTFFSNYTNNVISAGSAEDAFEKLKTVDTLDLKLLDIELPGENGIEMLPKLNQRYPDSETIMVTAYDDFNYVETSFSNNTFDYIVKPVLLNSVFNQVSRALQMKGLKSLLMKVTHLLFNESITQNPTTLFNELATRQLDAGNAVTMADFYAVFPNYTRSKLTPNRVIPKEIIEDGITLFKNALDLQLQHNAPCTPLLDDWAQFVASLGDYT